MTPSTYERTQPGTAMMVAVLLVLAVEASFSLSHPISTVTVVVTLLLLAVGVVFSTMTVAVSHEYVEWWFTFGALHQRLAISKIELAMSEKVTLLNGLGVRANGKNWLWIVNGSDVLTLNLRDGRKISVGSPEAQDLALRIERIISEKR